MLPSHLQHGKWAVAAAHLTRLDIICRSIPTELAVLIRVRVMVKTIFSSSLLNLSTIFSKFSLMDSKFSLMSFTRFIWLTFLHLFARETVLRR